MEKKTFINIGETSLNMQTPLVMAILNVTPDSFYGKSRCLNEKEIRNRVEKIVTQGADIVDIGGYSSRPGADNVSPEEEYLRVSSALKIVREIAPIMPISIDTFRSSVAARVAREIGKYIVNDISAGELDRDMMTVVGELKLPYIAMHMRGTPQNMQNHTTYTKIVDDVMRYFDIKINEALRAGIEDIIIDPGFGFAKSVEQNYELLRGMEKLLTFGLPILAGISRKSMIWKTLNISSDNALSGTIALNWECLRSGAKIIRVHDVEPAVQVVKLFNKYSENL